jgi:hypothetical protein
MPQSDNLLKWAAFSLMLGGLSLAIAGAGDLMRPIKAGNAADFWSSVYGVPLSPGQDPHRAFQAQGGVFLYGSVDRGIELHGDPLWAAPAADVLAAFPQAIDRMLADPGKLSDVLLIALINEKIPIDSRSEALRKLATDRDAIGRSPGRLAAFLDAANGMRLEAMATQLGPQFLSHEMEEAAWKGSRVDRARHYWLNILFEAAFFTAVIGLFWLPILRASLRRRLPLIWGSLVLVVLIPYYFGYCRMAVFWPLPDFWGGALYPWVLQLYRPLHGLLYGWEGAVLSAIGWVLEPLNQASMIDMDRLASGMDGHVGLVAPALIAGIVTGILYVLDGAYHWLIEHLGPHQA